MPFVADRASILTILFFPGGRCAAPDGGVQAGLQTPEHRAEGGHQVDLEARGHPDHPTAATDHGLHHGTHRSLILWT